ncbi:MAG: gluconate 2-dehydrogenase subunit 3 family protein [Gemmatimonadota bacterium]|nr:gluconate 2-dehydrogenase subunit 3 family protein [Gemmatimonadota bacterium]
MTELTRRELLTAMGLAAFAAACEKKPAASGDPAASPSARSDGQADVGPAQFFTPHELATVTMLADMVIPRDDRSGSASDAGAPVYMDYALREVEQPETQLAFRGGLAWIDTEMRERFGTSFVEATPEQRAALLDDVAFPERARPELRHGVAFFNSFRDLLATAFWSSQMGVRDLRYTGGVAIREWNGCPDENLQRLGVSYG